MTKKNLLLFPLYYNASSIARLHQYLIEGNYLQHNTSVLISNGNKYLSEHAVTLCKQFGFMYVERDNFGGGEGSLIELVSQSELKLNDFSNVIYLEESCEPMSKKWLQILIDDLKQSDVTGWHWNWKARSRIKAKPETFGSSRNVFVRYRNARGNHPLDPKIGSEIFDVPGFRHECIGFNVSSLIPLLKKLSKEDYSTLAPKEFGLSMERFYWVNNGLKIPCPNVQHQIILQGGIPSYRSKNYFLFRELSMMQRTSENYMPASIFVRQVSLIHLFKTFRFSLRNRLKFLLVIIFRIKSFPSKHFDTI